MENKKNPFLFLLILLFLALFVGLFEGIWPYKRKEINSSKSFENKANSSDSLITKVVKKFPKLTKQTLSAVISENVFAQYGTRKFNFTSLSEDTTAPSGVTILRIGYMTPNGQSGEAMLVSF
jgi:hypothetical protein